MPLYRYKGTDKYHNPVNEVIQAKSIEHAKKIVKRREHNLLNIREVPPTLFERIKINIVNMTPVNQDKIVVITKQLATNITSGIPLIRALQVIGENEDDKSLRRVLESVTKDIRNGNKVSTALAQHSRFFPPFYVAMVRTAEHTGKLGEILHILAGYMERDLHFQKKFKAAMTYPIFLLVATLGLLFFMSCFFLPIFSQIFADIGLKLPLSTRIVLGVADILKNPLYAGIFLFLIVAGLILFKYFLKYRHFKKKCERFMLKIPVLGKLVTKVYLTRISQALSIMYSSGVPFLRSLSITKEVANNELYKEALENINTSVEDGATFADALSFEKLFPDFFVRIIRIGEATGTMNQSLYKISEFYGKEIEQTLEQILLLVEPLIVIIMSITIGFVIVSVLMPMYQIVQQF